MKNIMVLLSIVSFLFTTQVYAQNKASADKPNAKTEYSKSIVQHLKNHWEYKLTPENKAESVVVMLRIDESGKILERKVLKHSTDNQLNSEVFKQLSAMEPFPSMPDEFGAEYIKFNYTFVPNALVINDENREEIKKVINDASN